MSCPFCLIWAGEAPAEMITMWGDAMAIRPLNPVTPGHALIIPGEHVEHALADPEITGMVFRHAAELAARYAFAPVESGGYISSNLITSIGAPATQTVHHLHVHVVPRREGDGLTLPWTRQVRR